MENSVNNYVFIDVLSPENKDLLCFCYVRMSLLYVQRVVFHRVHHAEP